MEQPLSLEEQFTVFPIMETQKLFLRQMMIEDAKANFGFSPILNRGRISGVGLSLNLWNKR